MEGTDAAGSPQGATGRATTGIEEVVERGRHTNQTRSDAMETSGRRPKTMNGIAVGDLVEVRPVEEILAGLDERAERDALQFMPEMLEFCGKQFVVDSIAHKTCDTVNITGLHRMENTVHLGGLRCNGQAHGGCQAGCLIFWKTDWLRRVSPDGTDVHVDAEAEATSSPTGCTPERLHAVAQGVCRREERQDSTEVPVYSCQTTELPRAIDGVVPMWDVRQYVDDVRYGNAPLGRVVRGIVIELFNLAQAVSRRVFPPWLRIKGGVKYPFIVGTARRMPVATLGLEPGDWVKVKSAEEIAETLDKDYRNRGLYFDRELLKYCGRTLQVLRRVDKIIDEKTGRMISMKTPSVILAGGVCTADFHRSCPRSIYAYWREIWLERVPAPASAREEWSENRAQQAQASS